MNAFSLGPPATLQALSGFVLGIAAAALLSSCRIKPERDYPNRLESDLRVLAIKSEPAEIGLGDEGTLSALVYRPPASAFCDDEEEVKYEWSWCPLRGGADVGFECATTEAEAKELWSELGMDVPLPPFDLGNSEEAEYLNLFGDVAVAVCADAVSGEDETAELQRANCVESLQVSVRLKVSLCGQSEVALKTLSLLGEEETNDLERAPNKNPSPAGTMSFRKTSERDSLEQGEPLSAGSVYWMNLELDSGLDCGEDDPPEGCVAETFVPDPIPGLEPSDARRETLIMSWFVTKGNTNPDAIEGEDYEANTGSNGGQTTRYLDGRDDIKAMMSNLLDLIEEPPGDAEVIVVLRDERGGVDWARFPVAVESLK